MAWGVVGTALVACSSTPDVTMPTFGGPPDRVIVQLGDYNLGWNLDAFVTGPQATIAADGRAFTELNDFRSGGVTQEPTMTGVVSVTDLAELVALAERLPRIPSVGTEVIDGLPTRLTVLGTTWDVWEEPPAEFTTLLERLDVVLRESASEPWAPGRWVERPFPSAICRVGPRPADEPWYSAPVFPFASERFPAGTFDCTSP